MAKQKVAEKSAPKNKIAPNAEPVVETEKMPELDVVPYFDEKHELQFSGNYDAVKAYLAKRFDEFKKVKFTSSNIDIASKYLKEAVGYRTGIEAIETQGKKKYFNAPKDVYVGKIADLYRLTTDMEAYAKKEIDKEEARRVENLNAAFDEYKAELQETHQLSPEGLLKVEYKKQFYNKGQKEADSRADIAAQFTTIKTAETARASSETFIKKQCLKDARLNEAHFLERLDQGVDLAIILDEIDSEKDRLSSLTKTPVPSPEPTYEITGNQFSSAPPEKISVGVFGAVSASLKTDFPGRMKTTYVKVMYPCDLGEALTEVFEELALRGIESEVVTAENVQEAMRV